MKNYVEELHELCETVSKEIAEANKKIRSGNGKLSAGDVEYLDKLTHMLKSIKTTVAMIENEEGNDYSNRYWPMHGGSYADGGSYRNSYARGGRNNNPMGRNQYSRTGGFEELISEMWGMMGELPEEKRRETQRFIEKIESM